MGQAICTDRVSKSKRRKQAVMPALGLLLILMSAPDAPAAAEKKKAPEAPKAVRPATQPAEQSPQK